MKTKQEILDWFNQANEIKEAVDALTPNENVEDDGNGVIPINLVSSPLEFVATSVSDLTNPLNANKIAALQSDITLIENITLADNLIIKGDGGKITGAFTLTGVNTGFISQNTENTIIDNNVILAGTYNPTYKLWFEWFGGVRHTESAFFDNHNALKNAIFAAKHNTLYINEGHYYKSVFEIQRFDRPLRPNITITGANTHIIGMGKEKTKIEILPNDTLAKSVAFVARFAPNGSFQHIWLKGDLDVTGDTQNEHRSGLTIENNSHDFQVLSNRLSHFSGDGLNSYSWDDFGGSTFTFVAGGINTTTGLDESKTQVWRSNLLSISSQAKQQGYGLLSGQGFGGYSTLSDFSYTAFWYDASDNFIDATPLVYTYKDIPIPDNATKIRVVINKPINDVAPKGLRFRGLFHSKRVIVAYNEIDHNFRNGISNMPQETKIIYNHFHDNGGRIGGPGYAICQEDGYQALNDVEIAHNVFENNFTGDVTMRWILSTYIHHNTFKGNATLIGGKSNINARETWNCQISNNSFYNTDVSLGRGSELIDNYMETSRITMASVYTRCEGNIMYNPSFNRSGDSNTAWGHSLIKNNTIIVTRPFTNNMFSRGLKLVDNIVDFRNGVTMGTIGMFPNFVATEQDGYRDSIEGLEVINAQGVDNTRGISIYPMDMNNSNFDEFLFVQGGIRDNFTWKDNDFVKRIEFISANTPFTNDGSDFKTVKIIGGKITSFSSDLFAGRGVLTCPAIDLNFYIKGHEFDLTDMTSLNSAFVLNHNGYLIFENCIFKTDAASTWDMNLTTIPTAVFKNCIFINVTPTFRSTDVVSGTEIVVN